MSSPRNITSVDLGDVCYEALESLVKQTKRTQSEVIRDSILICYHFGLAKDFNAIRQAAEDLSKGKHTPRTKSRTTVEEKRVIDTWRETFNYNGRIHNAAVLNTIRSAAKTLDYDTICDIIELSPNNAFVASCVTRGDLPQLNMILSEKMIPQLLTYVEQVRGQQVERDQMTLEGTIKPLALSELRIALDANVYSYAFDKIMAASSEKEVNEIRKAAMQGELDKALAELGEAVHGEED
jgi:hypothetical protein